MDREIVLAAHRGTAAEDTEITRCQERARSPEAGAEAFGRLAWAYVAKARRTLDAGFYKLAEKTEDVSDAQFGATADSRLLRGHILHNLHRFRDAEAVARQLVTERGLPADLALLSDALIEQGELAEGMAVLQRMVNARPGTEAYSRIAHVRWLKGDLPGAIAAMESAQKSSDPRDKPTRAWLLTRLAGFYLQRGDAALSLRLAEAAGEEGAYAPALLARGRALIASGKIRESIEPLREAAELQPLPEYQWWLADALAADGQRSAALEVEFRLKAHGAVEDPRTFALFLATRAGDAALALRLARAELGQRADVFSHDALAWAAAAAGDFELAQTEMGAALAEGTKDARLLWHAGELALERGDADAAAAFFREAQTAAGTLTPSERARLVRRSGEVREVAAK